MTGYDMLVVGGVGVDTAVRVRELPVEVRDSIGVPPIRDYPGHTGNGVALGCHALGLITKFIDVIGDDPQGHMILDHYARRGLDFSYLVHPSGTRRSVNLVDKAGRRMSFYDGRHPMDLRISREFYWPFLEQARHVHLSIMNFARYLYEDVHRLGRTVSTDLHDWDGEADYHRDFAYGSDIVFLSAAAVRDRAVELMHSILQEGRAQVVVAMVGEEGSWLLMRGQNAVVRIPAARLDLPIVDTNGAGDSYVAGFLYGYRSLSADWEECARLGAIAGAYACATEGTHTDFIDAPTLHRYCQPTNE